MLNQAQRVHFKGRSDFYAVVKDRVNRHFAGAGSPRTGTRRMFLKTAVIMGMLVGSYLWLVFGAETPWAVLCAALGVAAGNCLMGFNVMHDGAHGAYAQRFWVNRLMGYTLDLMGGSHYLWRQKHNVLHHTYTNIDVFDRDLQSSGLMRLSPDQAWRPLHRFQVFYALPLYSLHTFFWALYRDYLAFLSGRAGPIPLTRPTRTETVIFVGTKFFYYGYALVLPAFFHPLWQVAAVFTGIHLVMGVVLSLVFQLAHATEGPAFPAPDPETGALDAAWAVHQVETTADFAPDNPMASWCLGGLNFQIEHHLFPHLCHVHYPAIYRIVRETCREYGVRHHCFPTVRAAIQAHFRFLARMAQPPIAGANLSCKASL